MNPNVSCGRWVRNLITVTSAWAPVEAKTGRREAFWWACSLVTYSGSLTWLSCTGPWGLFSLKQVLPLSLFTGIWPFLIKERPGKINSQRNKVHKACYYEPRAKCFSRPVLLGFSSSWGLKCEGGKTLSHSTLAHQAHGINKLGSSWGQERRFCREHTLRKAELAASLWGPLPQWPPLPRIGGWGRLEPSLQAKC